MDGMSGIGDMAGLYAASASNQTSSEIQVSVMKKALEATETSMKSILEGLGGTIDARA